VKDKTDKNKNLLGVYELTIKAVIKALNDSDVDPLLKRYHDLTGEDVSEFYPNYNHIETLILSVLEHTYQGDKENYNNAV